MSIPEDSVIKRLEELGPNQVRTMISSGQFPTGWNFGTVLHWLTQKDQEERLRNDASQSLQIRTALSAKNAAWIAAIAAIIAAIFAAISIAVGLR